MIRVCSLSFLFISMWIINQNSMAAVFDDFNSGEINYEKWYSNYYENEPIELYREVVGGKLKTKLRGKIKTAPGMLLHSFGLANSNAINSISADVIYEYAEAKGSINFVGPQIEGIFYTSSSGDVWAGIALGFDGVNYSVEFALNVGGTGIWPTETFSIPIHPGVSYKIGIAYDNDRNFTFSVNGENHVMVGPVKTGTSANAYKNLMTGAWAFDSAYAIVKASFDNVYVNGSLYEEFNSSPLDPTKWMGFEAVREVRDNQLQLNVQNVNTGRKEIDLDLYEAYVTNYIQADITMESDSFYSGVNTYGEARIYGNYFNTIHNGSGYNGDEGEVYAFVRIRQKDTGELIPSAMVVLCENANCTLPSVPNYNEQFSCHVVPDYPVRMSIEKIDNQFIFKCDDSTLTYDVPGVLFPPSSKFRALRSRIYSNAMEYGFLKVKFDNIYLNKNDSGRWNLFLTPIINNDKDKIK